MAYNLGALQKRLGGFEAAAEAYRRALQSKEEVGDYSLLRAGNLYHKMGEPDSARKALEAFLERWEGDPQHRRTAERLLEKLH